MPSDFIGSVNRRKKVVVHSTETPRLPEENKDEIREVYDLWSAWAHESGNGDGKLDREALIDILAGRHHAEFSWLEAREAADRMFAELPSDVDSISFADLANHLQDVLAVTYSEVRVVKTRVRAGEIVTVVMILKASSLSLLLSHNAS